MELGKMVSYKLMYAVKTGVIANADEMRDALYSAVGTQLDNFEHKHHFYDDGYDAIDVTISTAHRGLSEIEPLLEKITSSLGLSKVNLISFESKILED